MIDPRLKLALIALLFFAPLGAATLAYVMGWVEGGRSTYGTLVTPVRALPALDLVDPAGTGAPTALGGKWSLIHLGNGSCDASCEEQMIVTRQVRLALAKHRQRVQRVYLARDAEDLSQARAALQELHPDLVFLLDRDGAARRFFNAAGPALFLTDPLGHWVMTYPGPLEPKSLHRDLRKLLRFSQVG